MEILISGGAGFIGSVIAGCLARNGHTPVILDNLSGGREESARPYPFYRGDMADRDILGRIVRDRGVPFAAIHCAALTIVPESVRGPERDYEENESKALGFFRNLGALGCRRIFLSGSASVYGRTDGGSWTRRRPPHREAPAPGPS